MFGSRDYRERTDDSRQVSAVGSYGVFLERIYSAEVVDEMFCRTLPYESWQSEHWLAYCDDFCVYIGDVGTREL